MASGFVPNPDKSVWEPVQLLEWLGATLDSKNGMIFIPNRRIEKVFITIREIQQSIKIKSHVHVKKVASLVGQIISMSIVIGNIAQIMTRYLSMDILLLSYLEFLY